jgi:aminocarboxymuconate-semialdehyde decarboxylase
MTIKPHPVIDMHAHYLHAELVERCAPHSVQTGFGMRPFPGLGDPEGKGAVYARMADPDRQLADMDLRGIDVNVVSGSAVLQDTSWAEAEEECGMIAAINDGIGRWTRRHPDRFISAFSVPLQETTAALREINRVEDLYGAQVVALSTNVRGRYMGDRIFDPFWRELEQRGLVAFIHPHGIQDPWFQDFRMWNSIGQSIEEVKVMASLIYNGIPEKFPGLKIVMAHGGGYFPYYMGRMDRNVHNYPDSMRNITKPPSEYLRFFHYDTCVYDASALERLIGIVGADRLVFGSDYPVGDGDPLRLLRTTPGLDADGFDRICRTNPAALLAPRAPAVRPA